MPCAADVVSSLENKFYFLMFAHCIETTGNLSMTGKPTQCQNSFFLAGDLNQGNLSEVNNDDASCKSVQFICAQDLCSGSLVQGGEQGEGDTRGGGSWAQCVRRDRRWQRNEAEGA